jgi:hypothetical protein
MLLLSLPENRAEAQDSSFLKGNSMFTQIKRVLAAPAFEDEEQTRVARLLYATLITLSPFSTPLCKVFEGYHC